MKILHLTTHLNVGGIPVYVLSLAEGLKRAGHTPIVASDGGWLERHFEESEIPHWKVPCRTSSELNPKLWFSVFPKLFRMIRQEKPDLIHAHTRIMQVLAEVLSWVTGVPYVTTCHGLYKFRWGRRIFRCWGEKVMAISTPSMDQLVRQYRMAQPREVVLVRNGVHVEHFMEPVSPDTLAWFRQTVGLHGSPVIGAVARFSPVKGLDLVIKTVPALLKKFPHLQVLLVGDGPTKQDLIQLAFQLGVQKHVVLVHPVEDTRIPLSLMDIFVAPAFQEGFGLAIVEAMSKRIPVVATNQGGPAEIIQHGKSGLLVPPGQPERLTEALMSLLIDPKRSAEIGEAGRVRVMKEFNMERVVREVERVYEEVIG